MFDEHYYQDIWGSIHRHDYCQDLAKHLIQIYGRGRYLDIGSGCGYLVKSLRDQGCHAHGLERSKYALRHSCVRLICGDMRAIPFADNSFDVLFSQGVWEYIPEGDITTAWKECQRVAQQQHHNIDYAGAGLAEDTFITARSQSWWEAQLR